MKKTIINGALIGILTIFTLAFIASSCKNRQTHQSQEDIYETVPSAYENGHLKWGMTYKEVEQILGPTLIIDEYDGIVTGAFYDHSRYGLYFDNNGKLESISRDGRGYKSKERPEWD